jgi:Lrp/AsnC family leucine-responsive transcriptional regulator
MTDFLDEKRREIQGRLKELKPLVDEYHRLEAAERALSGGAAATAAACLRRAQKLREGGVIERDVSILSPEAIGRRLTMIVTVALDRQRLHEEEAFIWLMREAAEVMECYHITGGADYVLILSVADMQAYEAFTRRYFYERYIKRFESMAALERVKFSTAVPMAGGEEVQL